MPTAQTIRNRLVPALFVTVLGCCVAMDHAHANETLDSCPEWERRYFLSLAQFAQAAYVDNQPGLEKTASGCSALVASDSEGNMTIAFRSAPRAKELQPIAPSSSAAKNLRRLKQAYKNWANSNIKHAAGVDSKLYNEATALVLKHLRRLPAERRLFVTGHSTGGGLAEYAVVAIHAKQDVSTQLKARLFCITFNPVIVRSLNWEKLFRARPGVADELRQTMIRPGKLVAVTLSTDPFSYIAAGDRGFFGRNVVIEPQGAVAIDQEHAIETVINELSRSLPR